MLLQHIVVTPASTASPGISEDEANDLARRIATREGL
jgi:hypothetical protein